MAAYKFPTRKMLIIVALLGVLILLVSLTSAMQHSRLPWLGNP